MIDVFGNIVLLIKNQFKLLNIYSFNNWQRTTPRSVELWNWSGNIDIQYCHIKTHKKADELLLTGEKERKQWAYKDDWSFGLLAGQK